jgi:putative acetyltransferase
MAEIGPGDFSDPQIIALLDVHVTLSRAATSVESAHALDISCLAGPNISVWTAWEGNVLVGLGALNELTNKHGEVNSMHAAEAARGRGIAGTMLAHIIAIARARNYARIGLETGSMDTFRRARALYASHGFLECAPFGAYKDDPNSTFMTLVLGPQA